MAIIRNLSDGERRELTGGRGSSVRLIDPAVDSTSMSASYLTLKPHAPWGPYHFHEYAATITVILEGRAKLVAAGVEYELGPNTIVYVPPGEPHEMTASGDAELRKLDIYAPPRGSDVIEVPWDPPLID